MPRRLIHLYQRKRIININLNVVAAGLLAIACTKGVIWAVDLFLDRSQHLLFTIVALVSDMIFDVPTYYILHWVANHWRPLRKKHDASPKPPAFLKDATLIQFERALLAPIYYVLAGALMHILQDMGWHPGWAMVIAFTSGLLVTRLLHTAMGLYTGSFKDFPIAPPAPAPPTPVIPDPELRGAPGASVSADGTPTSRAMGAAREDQSPVPR